MVATNVISFTAYMHAVIVVIDPEIVRSFGGWLVWHHQQQMADVCAVIISTLVIRLFSQLELYSQILITLARPFVQAQS